MLVAVIVILIFLVVQTLLSTGVLAGALFVTGEESITKETLLKCLGITLMALLVALIPIPGFILLAPIVWFGALMSVFEKEFLEALIIAITCWVFNILIRYLLGFLLGLIGLAAS